jgi:4-amino-4-deoxy-L-arabinose transferase-like glycosyltransferase
MIIAVGAGGFALIVARLLSIPQNPWDDDQGAFLITAREIHEHGGIAWLWRTLWSGEFPEANRHPLYLALLSLWPTVSGGQILSAVLGTVTLAVLTASTSRRCGRLTAGAFCVLLGTNGAFCLFSTRVVCEVLLVLFVGLAWLIHLPHSGAPNDRALSPARCAAGGALLGLAWLSKGTGLVLFAGYLLWIAIAGLWPAVRRPAMTTIRPRSRSQHDNSACRCKTRYAPPSHFWRSACPWWCGTSIASAIRFTISIHCCCSPTATRIWKAWSNAD